MDAQYEQSELIALYDRLNVADEDRRFYRSRIGSPPKSIIDLGSGTGSFALELASAGFDVTAIDPAPGLLAYARQRDVGEKVHWIEGDAGDIPDAISADIVLMTRHAFQCLLTDEAIISAFQQVRHALKPAGTFLFETRNPDVQPWTG
jgi:SAM-dependent methyltransferase